MIETNCWDPGVDHHPPPEGYIQVIAPTGTVMVTPSCSKDLDTNLCGF